MTVADYQKRVTHREHLGWLAFLDREMNRPSRSDWYAMQVAFEVYRVLRPQRDINSFKLKFGGEVFREPAKWAIARWKKWTGYRE